MKKKYFSPLVIIDIAEVEHNFLNSERNATSSMDFGVEDIDDDNYWN